MAIQVYIHIVEREPEDDEPKFVWSKSHVIISTTDDDKALTDEVSYIALHYARQAMKERRLRHADPAR